MSLSDSASLSDSSRESPPISKTRWPLWRIVMAYAILLAIAFMSIWVIDRRVDELAQPAAAPAGGPQAGR
jgi:hypothetical protein